MNENYNDCYCPKFSVTEEAFSWMIIVAIIVWTSMDGNTLKRWKDEMMKFVTEIGSGSENTDDDVTVIDISGRCRGEAAKKIILGEVHWTCPYLLKWEKNMDGTVYFFDKCWIKEQKTYTGLDVKTNGITRKRAIHICIESDFSNNSLTTHQVTTKALEEIGNEERKSATRKSAGNLINGGKSFVEKLLQEDLQQQVITDHTDRNEKCPRERGKQRFMSPWIPRLREAGLGGSEKASFLSTKSLNNDDGRIEKTIDHRLEKEETQIENPNPKSTGSSNLLSAPHGHVEKIHMISGEVGSRSRSQGHRSMAVTQDRHGDRKNIKYGDNSWFYNRRIVRKLKEERKKKKEKKMSEWVDETVKEWREGCNVRLDGDGLVRSMQELNTSWTANHYRTTYFSSRTTERRVERAGSRANRRR